MTRVEEGILRAMPRLQRPQGEGLIYHTLNRGNNRQAVFADDEDFAVYLHALGQTKGRYPFRLYGYVLMTNHVHLLLAPSAGTSLSRIMQSLTVAHTWWYHRRRGTSGHVWQGRFKATIIQDDRHLLTVLRYIEANPLRAGIVRDAGQYRWSSFGAHGLGQVDPLLDELALYQELGRERTTRCTRWHELVHTGLPDADLAALRRCARTGQPYGSEVWVQRMAKHMGIRLSLRKRGRPAKKKMI